MLRRPDDPDDPYDAVGHGKLGFAAVPDEGPIDPACAAARGWIELVGLRDDPPGTAPVAPTDAHVERLLAEHRVPHLR